MLRIVGQRSDGYHLLQTVFQFIDWCDYLHFQITEASSIQRPDDTYGVKADDDLVVRAAKLLQVTTGTTQGAVISVEKHLPMGAGLGGGSSDAATTLIALNALWGLQLPVEQLALMGATLGADVPVFVRGFAAWAEGIGDECTPMLLDEVWYLLVLPDCHVSTQKIFAHSELTRDAKAITIRAFLAGDQRNDCLDVVRKEYKAVDSAMKLFTQLTDARMTGTGSTLYASFATQAQAQQVASQLPAGLNKRIVKGVNRSPLAKRLDQV